MREWGQQLLSVAAMVTEGHISRQSRQEMDTIELTDIQVQCSFVLNFNRRELSENPA